jgi:hypothetical protein
MFSKRLSQHFSRRISIKFGHSKRNYDSYNQAVSGLSGDLQDLRLSVQDFVNRELSSSKGKGNLE